MGFYSYFRIAQEYCPEELRGFEPALDYETARIMQAWEYDTRLLNPAFIDWAIHYAYDNIVERMGDEIAASHIQPTEKYVSLRNRKAGRKKDRRVTAAVP